jgi:hypothetical protein
MDDNKSGIVTIIYQKQVETQVWFLPAVF